MSSLQVRDVPADIHRTLKARAAARGQSLSEYSLEILAREASRPTLDELLERVKARGAVDIGNFAVETIRADRDAH